MPFRFLILFTLLFGISCSKPRQQDKERIIHIVNCIYKTSNNTLVKIDSLVNKHDYSELNSIYFNSGFNPEERVFLSNLMLEQYKYKFDFDSISHYILINDSILSFNRDIDLSLKIDFYKKKSDFFLKKGRLDSSVYYLKKIAGKDDFSKNSICYEKIKAWSDIGVAFTYYGGSLDSARYYLEKQEKLFTKDSVFNKLKYVNYYTQATIYRRLHKYQLSLTYLDMALNIQTNKIKNKLSIALTYDLKSNVLYEYEKYHKSVKYSRKAIELGEQINISNYYLKNFYIGIINALTQLDSVKQADQYIDKLLYLSKDDNNTKALSYKLKGILSFKSNKFDKADRFFKKAFVIYNSTKNPNYYYLAETCYLYSITLRIDEKFDKAIHFGNYCINAFLKDNNNDLNAFYSDPASIKYISNIAFIYSDKAKAENVLVSHKQALEKYVLVDSLISDFYNSIDQDVTLINQQSLDSYYYHYFDFCYSLFNKTRDKKYFTMAIDILSKYKGVALLKERMACNSFNSELKELKQKIEKIRFKLNEKKTKSDSINALLNRELKRLENYKLPLQTGLSNTNTLGEIEEYCRLNNQILVDYFFPFGDFDTDKGYVFVSDGNLSKIYSIDNVSNVLKQTDSTYQMLSGFSSKDSILNLKLAYLYDKLLFFINDDFKKQKTNSLLIIPDRNLYNIPFELLVTDMRSNKMLIEDFDISYSFSIKNLLLNSGVKEKTNTVLAFSYSDSRTISDWNIDSLTELPGGFREVQGIKKMFKDKCMVFSGMESTKKNFFDYAKDYSIIHLALHGKADENSRFRSCIYFRDGKKISPLYPYELMNHDINPDLMVLSSCQSARGKAYNQESMYSIAKSFYAGGAQKVISSLWDLDDEASKSIIDSFYKTIRNENSIQYSKALRKAKLSYLETIRNNNQKRSYIGSLVLYK